MSVKTKGFLGDGVDDDSMVFQMEVIVLKAFKPPY
jgi:hypothetical protein